MKLALITILAVLGAVASIIPLFIGGIDMTEMRLLVTFWEYYLAAAAMFITSALIIHTD